MGLIMIYITHGGGDVIHDGSGNDKITGGAGDDKLDSSYGNDFIFG